MKLEVLVIEPEIHQDDNYVCDFCNISYPYEDYKSLFNSKKIIYLAVPYHLSFDTKNKVESYSSTLTLCHSCFYTHLKASDAKKPIEITFLQSDDEIVKFYDPNDSEDSSFFFLPNG